MDLPSFLPSKMYRGFTIEDILILSEPNGQGEAMSTYGATGVYAAIEWIDTYHLQNGNIVGPQPFPWYEFDKLYPDVVDRSKPGKQ